MSVDESFSWPSSRINDGDNGLLLLDEGVVEGVSEEATDGIFEGVQWMVLLYMILEQEQMLKATNVWQFFSIWTKSPTYAEGVLGRRRCLVSL